MNKLLAGAEALRQLEAQSPEERASDHLLSQACARDYKAWLADLPVSKAHRELVEIVDRVRQRLISGAGIPANTADALRLWSRKDRREGKKFFIRLGVDSVRKIKGLPLAEATLAGPGAFEEAGRLFAVPPLSASQVRKIYDANKLPKNKKTRPLP